MGTTRKADYFGRTVIAAVVGLQFVLRSRKSAAGEKQNSGLRGVVFTAPFRVYLICAFAVSHAGWSTRIRRAHAFCDQSPSCEFVFD